MTSEITSTVKVMAAVPPPGTLATCPHAGNSLASREKRMAYRTRDGHFDRSAQGGSMTAAKNRQILLAARPHGEPTPDDFRLVEAEVPEPGPGQRLLRTIYLS